MAKKKTSTTGRNTGGKSVTSRKRTKAAASSNNGASRSKKTSKRSGTSTAAGPKKAAGKKAATKKAAAKKAATKKMATKKAAKAGASKKTTKKAGGSTKKVTKKAGKSPLTAKELKKYRDLLILKRAEILGDMSSMSEEALGSDSTNLSHMPIHMADVSSDGYERELMLGLVESERQMIHEIDEALQRIADGTYGTCEATGKPIAKSRLNVKPWAKYCIEAAREMERQNGSSRH